MSGSPRILRLSKFGNLAAGGWGRWWNVAKVEKPTSARCNILNQRNTKDMKVGFAIPCVLLFFLTI